jgi:Fic family protein
MTIFEPINNSNRLMKNKELYNWQRKEWPDFRFSLDQAEDNLYRFAEKAGHITGIWKAIPDNMQMEAVVDLMLTEAMKTSEIEGEYLSRKDVLSSIKANLGLTHRNPNVKDRKAAGIAELMLDVRNSFMEPLTKEKLFSWHGMIFQDTQDISVGRWRVHEEPMQIISGPIGKQKVHFEAPPSARVGKEMDGFLKWFNSTAPGEKNKITKAPMRAAIAHLYFETIHPFEDGNGRIGRAIAEKVLSQGMGRPVLLSLSRTIEEEKRNYYTALEKAQESMDITGWINYFSKTVLDAQISAELQIEFTLKKVKYFDRFQAQFNERQLRAISRMFQEGAGGFAGGMNAAKYIGITKTSKAPATRDLQEMVEMGALTPVGSGRNSRYEIKDLSLANKLLPKLKRKQSSGRRLKH